MSAAVAWALILGVVLGVGLWSLASLAPRLSRPSLSERTAPYLVDVSAGARQFLSRRSSDPLPFFGVLLSPPARVVIDVLNGVLGGTEQIERRLAQSRSSISVEYFRSQQLVFGVVGVVDPVVLVLDAVQVPGARVEVPTATWPAFLNVTVVVFDEPGVRVVPPYLLIESHVVVES